MESCFQLMQHGLVDDLVVEEGHVDRDGVGFLIKGVGELEQDVAVVVLVAFGAYQCQLAHGQCDNAGIGHIHAVVLLADGGYKMPGLELKVKTGGIVFLSDFIAAVVRLEEFLKGGFNRVFFLPDEHTDGCV